MASHRLHNVVAPAVAAELIKRVQEHSADPRDLVIVAESVLAAVVARCVPEAGQAAVIEALRTRLPGRVAAIRERSRLRPGTLN